MHCCASHQPRLPGLRRACALFQRRSLRSAQDRLISELRLAGAATIPEANAVLADFLPRFNERFRVLAQVLHVNCDDTLRAIRDWI